jgi:beta-lactamase class A
MFSPRFTLFCFLVCAPLCSASAQPESKPDATEQASGVSSRFESELNILATKAAATIGIGIRDLATGKDFFIHADRSFSLAGLSKVYVLAALMRESSQGRIDLNDQHTLSPKDKLPGGILFRLGDDSVTMSLRDYATLMATIDDNSAAQIILSRITHQAVDNTLRALGAEKIRFAGLVTDPQKPEDNLASPRDLLDCLHAIYRGPALDAASREEFFSILSTPRQGALRSGIPKHIRVASKSGIRGNLRCTAAVVFLKQHPYAIVIMSQPAPAQENPTGIDASTIVSAISKLTYEYFSSLESAKDSPE